MSHKQEVDLWNLYDNISDTFDTVSTNQNINKTEKDTLSENDICVSCNVKCDFKIEDGYKWCNVCGENNGIQIDTTAEWRYYGSEDSKSSDPTRCGMPANHLLYNMSCGTMISSRG